MQVFLTSIGCRLNEAEIAILSRAFGAAGHGVVGEPELAQLVVANTCAVTREAARKSRKLVAGLHRRNPQAELVVTGCYAHLEAEKVASLPGVDLVVDNRDKDRLVDIASERLGALGAPAPAATAGPEASHPQEHRRRTRAFVKVQDGCRNRCAFCVVTIARGRERSPPVEAIVDEIARLCAAGYQEAVLTGVHLGGYGSDRGADLRDLVAALLARTPMRRLRLSSLEPWDLPEDLWELWQSPRLMPHLHLPLQSGCDAVLGRMARRCTTRSYEELVAEARAAIPNLTLTTDIIVGFPGETDAEFAATVDFVRRIGFGHVHIFPFSPRKGTRAALLPGRVPAHVTRKRSRELHAVATEMRRDHSLRFLGQTRDVLWEGPGRRQPGGGRRWFGYTDNYLRVVTSVAPGVDLENRITPARLEGVAHAPPAQLAAQSILL